MVSMRESCRLLQYGLARYSLVYTARHLCNIQETGADEKPAKKERVFFDTRFSRSEALPFSFHVEIT